MLALLLGCLVASAQACNDIEDPIKRDAGQGPWNASRVERAGRKGLVVPVTTSNHLAISSFYQGDSYVIEYAVRANRKPDVIYYWQGSGSSTFEKGQSAVQAALVDRLNGNTAEQVRVEQGKEPAHFLNMFKGTFVTLLGGKDRETEVKDTDGVHLFKVVSECNSVGDKKPLTRTNQIEEKKSNLNQDDVFILKTKKKLFIYEAPKSSVEEQKTAEKVVASLFAGSTPVKVKSTPSAEFLASLN